MAQRTKRAAPARARARRSEETLLAQLTMRAGGGRGRRAPNDDERRVLLALLAAKRDERALEVGRLVPRGSVLARVLRLFERTDIAHALPLFSVIMIAASWLTQAGAVLRVPGLGEVHPALWTIGLAESGSAKTLANARVMRILAGGQERPPVRLLPTGSTDARWIEDLAQNPRSYWFQDEVGKFFHAVMTQGHMARIKPWMLSAYSHEPISKRLRDGVLEIERPMFTFHGLSVLSSWRQDVDAVSMLDGFCQRPNYYIATRREDTDLFDHFLYFAEVGRDAAEADLAELWAALCAQPGACGPYELGPGVLEWLEAWWRGLRPDWGDGAVPASFVRRIGYSVLRYVVVLQFLLGKSGRPIDVETARLAASYAEHHLECTRLMLEAYDARGVDQVRQVIGLRDRLTAERGAPPTPRQIVQRMSKRLRAEVSTEAVRAILEGLAPRPGAAGNLPGFAGAAPRARSEALARRLDGIEARLARSERKRNERRLRELRRRLRAAPAGGTDVEPPVNVVPLTDVARRPDEAAARQDRRCA